MNPSTKTIHPLLLSRLKKSPNYGIVTRQNKLLTLVEWVNSILSGFLKEVVIVLNFVKIQFSLYFNNVYVLFSSSGIL